MRPARLLLALRVADRYACAGDPELAVVTGVLPEAVLTERATTVQQLRGPYVRMTGRWGHLPRSRGHRRRSRDAGSPPEACGDP